MPESPFPPGLPLVVRPRLSRGRRAVKPMSLELRVFLGVFGALVAFAVLVLVLLFVAAQARLAHQRAVMQSLTDYAQRSIQASQRQAAVEAGEREEAHARAVEAQALWDEHRRLAVNERCLGGMVIRQDGATFTQLGAPGDPVRCRGALADRPIH